MSFQILVTQPVHAPVQQALQSHGKVWINPGPEPLSQTELIDRCQNANAVMAFMTERIDKELLETSPKLQIVAGALKGYNNMDVDACTRRGIFVTVVPDLLTEPTAELTVGLMIALARNMLPGDQYVRSGSFHGWRPRFYGGSLCGAKVAIIGAGAVGQAIIRMLTGFGCDLIYVDRKSLAVEQERQYACRQSPLDDALAEADFVVLAIHLMPETHHLVNETFLFSMKVGSYLINPARGSIVDENAVVTALDSGHLAGYATDTFEMEDWAVSGRPKAIVEGLRNRENSVLTPHIGSAVRSVRQQIEMAAVQSIIDVAEGRLPSGLVNPDAAKHR